MPDVPLPDDVPRLRTIEQWLLLQLAAVRRAIAEAESPEAQRRQRQAEERWVIQWRMVPAGQSKRGIVHRADCWMAQGELLTAAQVAWEREQPGRRLEPCDSCQPQAPVAE